MLSRIEITAEQGALLVLSLENPEGYVVENIDGLDPVKATIVSSSFANMDGEQYHSSRREKRNLIFTIRLDPDYTVETARELRKRLYDFFMPETKVHMRYLMDGEKPLDIDGTVESFDSPLFTKDPKATVSILCFDPDFVDLDPIEVDGFTTSESEETLIKYDGTVSTGFLLKLNVNRTITEFTVYHRAPDGTNSSMEFESPDSPLSAGDRVDISTVSGAKRATLLRSDVESSILYGISPYSNWINLFRGDNYIRVHADGEPISYSIEYKARYGGL